MAPNNVIQEDDGSWICHHCGTIASEHSRIVSDIQFAETASGAPAVQGQYIGADQTHARSAAIGKRPGYGAGGGDSMNSKQLTELSARREILALMANLRQKSVAVAQSFIDPAIGLFKLALTHNFVQGRSISTVAAVALYLQCRRSKETNEVMLIDIAECINVNVFVLGKMYTKLVQKLYGTTNQKATLTDKIDTINPENLIRRFAKGLDFEGRDARKRIVDDAIRLVQRMDRDWMATGRRPAGICGAALVLAARMNNFRRTVREVVLVVKVTEITINKRLEEFSYTDSSNLTVEQFRGITLERDCDPPAFYRARQEKTRKRGRKRKGALESAAEIEEEEGEDDEDEQEVATEPAQKRARIDSDGFAIPEIPIDPALRRSIARNPNAAPKTVEELPELSTLLGSSTGESPIDEALTLAVNSAISEMVSEEASSPAFQRSSSTEASGSDQREPEASSSGPPPGEQPRRRQGRPKGAKNWQPPPASAAELALEAEIEGEVRKVLESGLMQPFKPDLKSNEPASSSGRFASQSDQGGTADSSAPVHSSLSNPSSGRNTPPWSSSLTLPVATARADVSSTEPSTSITAPPTATLVNERLRNPPGVEDTTLVHLDDDPEVSSCILSQEEREIKERIWVAENADWLRKDHVKRIKAELQEAADREAGIDPDEAGQGRGKGRGRKKKRGRLGDVSYLDKVDKNKDGQKGGENGEEGGTARSAMEATLKMMAHRGYSRRVNYDVFKSLFPEEEEAARQRSSRSSTSTTPAEKRRDSGTRATASGSESPASTPAVEKDAAAGAEKTMTAIVPSSPPTSAPPSIASTAGSAAPLIAKPKPKPRPQARKAVGAVAVPIAEPGKPPPALSGPSRPANPPIGTFLPSSATTKRFGRAPGGQKGWENREARRQARATADAVMAKEWDEEAEEEEEVLDEAEREERAWMARTAPKDGPALASASAGEGVTKGTAVRLATPASRSQSLVRQLPSPAVTQTQPQGQVPAQISSPRIPATAIDIGEEEILGSIDDSPLTSLRSSVIRGDDDAGEGDDDDAADYVEIDEDDDVEAAFAGRFARRSESFDDDEDEEMDDV
jgi:transcription initiation factor TFIIIB Brf1 subunit/transcription initiation factor TFIIB